MAIYVKVNIQVKTNHSNPKPKYNIFACISSSKVGSPVGKNNGTISVLGLGNPNGAKIPIIVLITLIYQRVYSWNDTKIMDKQLMNKVLIVGVEMKMSPNT